MIGSVDLLLFTVNEHETTAVMEGFYNEIAHKAKVFEIGSRTYRDLGTINGTRVVHTLSQMGSGVLGGAQQTIAKAIAALQPRAIIAIGVAFGVDDQKQKLGDILVSRQLWLYESQRKGANGDLVRGDRARASSRLINYFEGVAQTSWSANPPVKFGLLLSGEKLIDSLEFRNELLKIEPESIGGEMEGAGLYVAASEEKVDWIVIKAICDWAANKGAGNKDLLQKTAAENAVKFLICALKEVSLASIVSDVDKTFSSHCSSDHFQERKSHAVEKKRSEVGDKNESIANISPNCNNFIERTGLIKQIEISFLSKLAPVVVSGLWGLGKTELARQFANDRNRKYQIKWWIRCDNEVTRLTDYSALAVALGLVGSNLIETIGLVISALAKRTDWLIIFDNVAGAESLYVEHNNERFPLTPLITQEKQHVLITSQNSCWLGYSVIDSLRLDEEDSLKILQSAAPVTTVEDAHSLNQILDGHALALQQAASYIANTKIDVPTYLKRLQTHQSAVFKAHVGQLVDNPNLTAIAVFDLCLKQVRSGNTSSPNSQIVGNASIALLFLCAYMEPELIDLELIRSNLCHLMEPLTSALSQDLVFDAVIAHLNSYSLINRRSVNRIDLISIHRFIQFLIKDLEPDSHIWAAVVLKIVVANFTYDRDQTYCEKFVGHALAITDFFSSDSNLTKLAEEQILDLFNLFFRLGQYLRFVGQLQAAKLLMEKALVLAEERGNDHFYCDYSFILSNLYLDLRELEKAEPHLKKTHALFVERFGAKHPNVGTVLCNLARLNQFRGNFDEAEKILARSMEIFQSFPLEMNKNVATVLNNMASLLIDRGEGAKAEKPLRLALLVSERHYGPEDLEMLKLRSNLATVCILIGNYDEAKELSESVLKVAERQFGVVHPLIGSCTSNLAVAYFNERNFGECEVLGEKSLAIQEKIYGYENPALIQVLSTLGSACTNQKKYDRAEIILKRCLQLTLTTFGEAHPLAATGYNNLGTLYYAVADHAKAEECLLQAISIRLTFFGLSHGDLNVTYVNLMSLYRDGEATFSLEHVVATLLGIQNKLLGIATESIRAALLRQCFGLNNERTAERPELVLDQIGRLTDETFVAGNNQIYDFALQIGGFARLVDLDAFVKSDMVSKGHVGILQKNTKVLLIEKANGKSGTFKILSGPHRGKQVITGLGSVKL